MRVTLLQTVLVRYALLRSLLRCVQIDVFLKDFFASAAVQRSLQVHASKCKCFLQTRA